MTHSRCQQIAKLWELWPMNLASEWKPTKVNMCSSQNSSEMKIYLQVSMLPSRSLSTIKMKTCFMLKRKNPALLSLRGRITSSFHFSFQLSVN